MNGEKFNSDRAPKAVGLYPHARKIGNLLFLSGVGPRKIGQIEIPGVTLNKNGEVVSYDIEKQCHAVFENIRFILEDAGSSWDNIVDVQVFLTNMKDDFKAYNKIYAEYFKNNMVLEGGSIHVDGEGTLIATEQTLLNPNRNPSMSKEDIEQGLRDYLGIEKVIWLYKGFHEDTETDGHVDNVIEYICEYSSKKPYCMFKFFLDGTNSSIRI